MANVGWFADDLGNEFVRKTAFLFLIIAFLLVSCTKAPEEDSHLFLDATKVSAQIFSVSANQEWADTRISLRKGESLNIAYFSGTITDGDSAVPNANGTGYICGHSNCCEPLPSVPRLALIGRVGEELFYIGNGGILTMPANGHLYLRFNDCDTGLYDNNGELSIIIFPERGVR